jgi:hypothetical protein
LNPNAINSKGGRFVRIKRFGVLLLVRRERNDLTVSSRGVFARDQQIFVLELFAVVTEIVLRDILLLLTLLTICAAPLSFLNCH